MKPGKGDRKHTILIQGDELKALKIVCSDMPECFGLDRRIAKYQGTRPIGFYPWDLDALVDTFEHEIMRPSKPLGRRLPAPDPSAVKSLHARVAALRDVAYQ